MSTSSHQRGLDPWKAKPLPESRQEGHMEAEDSAGETAKWTGNNNNNNKHSFLSAVLLHVAFLIMGAHIYAS